MKRPRRARGLQQCGSAAGQTPVAPANLRCWKHSRQNTGRPCVGRNGTVVSLPHAEQLVVVSTRSRATRRAGRRARGPLGLAALAAFGFVLEVLVGEEELLTRRPDELRSAVYAIQRSCPGTPSVPPLTNSLGPPGDSNRARSGRAIHRHDGPSDRSRAMLSAAASRTRGAASSAYACAPAPAWRGADRLASSRTNAS